MLAEGETKAQRSSGSGVRHSEGFACPHWSPRALLFDLQLKVPTTEKPTVTVNFRKLLLNRCQKEFEKDKDDDEVFEKKQKEMDEAATVRKPTPQFTPCSPPSCHPDVGSGKLLLYWPAGCPDCSSRKAVTKWPGVSSDVVLL